MSHKKIIVYIAFRILVEKPFSEVSNWSIKQIPKIKGLSKVFPYFLKDTQSKSPYVLISVNDILPC